MDAMNAIKPFSPSIAGLHRPQVYPSNLLFLSILLVAAWAVSNPTSLLADEVSVTQDGQFERIAGMVQTYCIDCHNAVDVTAEIDLESVLNEPSVTQTLRGSIDVWERVFRKVQAGQMPPQDALQPSAAEVAEMLQDLQTQLDEIAERSPRPGRTETFRRLTRYEYQNSIRDLLGLEIDATDFLPADEISHGFDNITVGELSPTLINRYISAAEKISRLAMGRPLSSPEGKTVRVPPDRTQEEHVSGLPLGTRGGTLFAYDFPQDGDYEIRIRLTRDRNEHVEGLREPHELEVLLDRERVQLFTVRPPRGGKVDDEYGQVTHANVDRHLKTTLSVGAGRRQVGVTFIKKPSSLLETQRQPLNVHYNMYRHPRIGPAIYQVSITGPLQPFSAPLNVNGEEVSPSRERILFCQPKDVADEEACAEAIISNLLRKACRGPVEVSDLEIPMDLFRQGREGGAFEDGIELALSGVLVNPKFLFRIERDPQDVVAGEAYQVSDSELATRLSFFLWSSLPDETLSRLTGNGQLQRREVLQQQIQRMLADGRSKALVENFASQWLYLRNVDSLTPDARLYPDFDDNLRQAFRRETELFVEHVFREDRSVLELLRADYTYLNERLAKHYKIPHVYGSHFRRVSLGPESRRGGLLRQGSVLSVTSYATRTSPVIRGKWVLENLLGTPTPPPPPNIPALADNTVSSKLQGRERLAKHRENPACASCHNIIDPIGFSLENFDALGRWRQLENGSPVDVSGGLPDGSQFQGVDGLEAGLLRRPEVFVTTLTEKLLTYAIGRGLEPTDGAAVRQVVLQAKENEYRLSSIVEGIVNSTPFQMRTAR